MSQFQQRSTVSNNSNNKSVSNESLIITIPLNYTYFVKPTTDVLFEALIKSNWRVEDSTTSPTNPFFQSLNKNSLIYDNLQELRMVINQINENYASFGIMTILNEFKTSDSKITISIVGNYSTQKQMNEIRLLIFQNYSEITKRRVLIDFNKNDYCFNSLGKFKDEFLIFLNDVSKYNKCSLYISNCTTSLNRFELIIIGNQDQSNVTENKVRLFIDDLNPNSFCDYLEIESISLLPLIGGKEFANFKMIIKQTNCHLYLPNLTPELYYNNSLSLETGKPKLFITGLRSMVLLTKNLLADITEKICKTPFIKQLSVMPIKRESLILFNKDKEFLKNIMFETGCFISIPTLGYSSKDGNGDIISFQGNSIEEVELSMDKFMNLMSGFYSAKYEITTTNSLIAGVNKLLNFSDQLSFNSNTIVSLTKFDNDYIFQVIGQSKNIKTATNPLNQFPAYIDAELIRSSIQYQIELPNKEKDFIAGKKNGKIIKIMNMSSVSIKLLPFNDYSFVLEINCNDLIDSILGLGLFEDELPTMLTFNVPESFHRQIIGVGGQTVQSIMRKFNVFIKFSNSFELNEKTNALETVESVSTNFQQSFLRKNNVIIKCPSKNKSQIPLAKLELEKLVNKVIANNYSCIVVKLTLSQWKLLTCNQFNVHFNLNKKKPTNFITELEKLTNTFISYPKLDQVDSSRQYVELKIYGIENNPSNCCNELKKLLPYSYEVKLIDNNETPGVFYKLVQVSKDSKSALSDLTCNTVQLDFMNNIIVPLKLLYNVELELKQAGNNCSVFLNYYPESFGILSNCSILNNNERLNDLIQLDLIKKDEFQQILSNLKTFLTSHKFEIIQSHSLPAEFTISYITSSNSDNVNSSKELGLKQVEKENLSSLSGNKYNFNKQFVPSGVSSGSSGVPVNGGHLKGNFSSLSQHFQQPSRFQRLQSQQHQSDPHQPQKQPTPPQQQQQQRQSQSTFEFLGSSSFYAQQSRINPLPQEHPQPGTSIGVVPSLNDFNLLNASLKSNNLNGPSSSSSNYWN